MKDFKSLKLDVGDKIPTLELSEISRSSLALYSEASGDNNPIHTDIDFAKESGGYFLGNRRAQRAQRILGGILQNPQNP